MSKSDSYEVRDPELESALESIAEYIGGNLPPGLAFSLLVFTLEPGAAFYISNAERGAMLRALQEFIRSNKQRGY